MTFRDKLPGFTLIELVLVIVIISILAAQGFRALMRIDENLKFNYTIDKMKLIEYSISGNPELVENNARIDFGYIGDTGVVPPTLKDLMNNVSNVTGWDGPYIAYRAIQEDSLEIFRDAWGDTFTYVIPASDADPVTLTSNSGGGDNIVRNVTRSVNSVLNNLLSMRIRDTDGYPIRDTEGGVDVYYAGSWHSLNYTTSKGFYLSTVPIGILDVRIHMAGDTTYKQMIVEPNNVSPSAYGLEYTIHPIWGSLNYVGASASLGGTNNSEVTFDILNTGGLDFDIEELRVSWKTSACWECDYAFMSQVDAGSATYWEWNTNNRYAKAPDSARIVLDDELPLKAGTTTIGPLTFYSEEGDGGTFQMMDGVDIKINLFSSLAPDQTIAFTTPGSCNPASIMASSVSVTGTNVVKFDLDNSGDAQTTLTGFNIKSNIGTLPPYLESVDITVGAVTNIYWIADKSWCNGEGRKEVNNVDGANISFCVVDPIPIIQGGSSLTVDKLVFYTDAYGSIAYDMSGVQIIIDFTFECGSNQSVTIIL